MNTSPPGTANAFGVDEFTTVNVQGSSGRALGVGEVKFTGQVLPTARKVTYRISVKRFINRKLILAIADGVVEVDGRPIYEANDLRVGLFENTSSM